MARARLAIVLGTRPEAIKLAPVIKAFRRVAQDIDTRLISTAQHRQILDQVLNLFHLTPDLDLGEPGRSRISRATCSQGRNVILTRRQASRRHRSSKT